MKKTKDVVKKRMNKKTLIVVGICCIVVLSVGLFCLFQRNNRYIKETEVVITEFLQSYKAKQPDTFKYLQYPVAEVNMQFEGFQGILAEQIDFEIENVRKEHGQIVASVEITNIDLKEVFINTINDLPEDVTQDDILKELETRMQKGDCATKKFDCEIIVINDNGYKVIITDTLSNALLGGYNEYLAEMVEKQEVQHNE